MTHLGDCLSDDGWVSDEESDDCQEALGKTQLSDPTEQYRSCTNKQYHHDTDILTKAGDIINDLLHVELNKESETLSNPNALTSTIL